MRGCPERIEAGSVYLLDDFTHAQVTAVTPARICFKARRGASCLVRWRASRGLKPAAFRRRVRARVEGTFFPEFDAGNSIAHSRAETAALQASLHDVARHQPLGPNEPGAP